MAAAELLCQEQQRLEDARLAQLAHESEQQRLAEERRRAEELQRQRQFAERRRRVEAATEDHPNEEECQLDQRLRLAHSHRQALEAEARQRPPTGLRVQLLSRQLAFWQAEQEYWALEEPQRLEGQQQQQEQQPELPLPQPQPQPEQLLQLTPVVAGLRRLRRRRTQRASSPILTLAASTASPLPAMPGSFPTGNEFSAPLRYSPGSAATR